MNAFDILKAHNIILKNSFDNRWREGTLELHVELHVALFIGRAFERAIRSAAFLITAQQLGRNLPLPLRPSPPPDRLDLVVVP